MPRETVPSFLSRLAAMRRTEMAEFAQNMGVSVRRFLDGDPEALAGLVTWGGVTPAQLAELQSWSGEAIGEVRTRFRGEVFVSRALRNPVMRGCPVCLREDAQGHTGPAAEVLAMRGDWQLCIDPVEICSCYKGEGCDECDDGRQHQTVDGEA
ncbi:hypothetical protein U716_10505 [Rhodobacter capsulatus B6]|nr:hypothetical protein U716_10505 [Rhodobacter capsulatus B6]